LFFRRLENGFNYVYKVEPGGQRRVVADPIATLHSCSTDGEWVIVGGPVFTAYNTREQRKIRVCEQCWPNWSRDGKYLFVTLPPSAEQGKTSAHHTGRKVHAIAMRGSATLLAFPAEGITAENVGKLPGVTEIEFNSDPFRSANDLTTYPIVRGTVQRNIYRIPIP